jgi:hypothetical protein
MKKKMEGMDKTQKDKDALMKKELASVLSPDQLATFDEYEKHLPERMLENSYATQLSMMSPSLTPENRTRTVQVIIEEMRPGLDPNQSTQQAMQMQSFQQEAFARARDRLAQELEADQLAQVDSFIAQQQMMQQMGKEFLQNFMGGGNKKPAEAAPK